MTKLLSFVRSGALNLTALLLIFSSAPVAVWADDECTPPPSDQPGIHTPIGADAATYTYQCDGPYAGLWSNNYYTYNPDNGQITAIYAPDYQYNCGTGQWTKANWVYAPAQGVYQLYRVSTSAPAGVSTGCGVAGLAGSSIGNTGPGSNNGTNANGNSNTNLNNSTGASVNNTITGVSSSGSSQVLGNTIAGGASTGNAQDIANVINLLQSSSDALGTGNLVTFVTNIDGDVNGDFLLDPASINSVQNTGPGSTNTDNTNLNNNLTVNNSANASINNTINLDAGSGDANVSGNNTAGDAKTGSAQAVANVVNMINSALKAGKSFLGVININGNLNGDILLPPDFVDQLIAANVPTVTITTTGPGSTNTSNNNSTDNSTVTNTNNQGITNNVNAKANSGQANVSGNTNAGSASSGNAKTNITAFNLTGSNVIGSNDILVFVNVAGGKWVGLIVNAPPGATAASLGGHVISNTGPGSSNSSNSNSNSNTTVNNTANQKINNDINANAHSGNANVSNNTNAGNATTGDADVAVNLLNVENSTLDLSGWFGILFINVFGTWNGSFGINTSAGDPIAAAIAAGASPESAQQQFINFVQTNGGGHGFDFTPFTAGTTGSSGNNSSAFVNAVLAANKHQATGSAGAQLQDAHSGFKRTATIISLLVAIYIISDAVYSKRRSPQS